MHICIDFESYSCADLKKTGAYKYSEHPSTEVLCIAYAFNDGEPILWHPGLPPPLDLFEAIEQGAVVDAHNVGFERAVWENVCVKRMGWPEIEPHKYDCTMARAASRALPLGLEQCAAALGLDVRKDKRGKQLINLLCKPQKPRKKDPRTRIQDPELLAELYDYCKQDVRVEQRIRKELGALPAPERGVFLLNEKMNARGITIDVESVHNAIAIVKEVEKELTAELVEITGGRVQTANQVAEILDFVQWKVDGGLDDLTADTVAAAIPRAEAGSAERRVLEIRASLAKASTKKLAGLLSAVCADGRVRGLSQYHGAFTGRNAGRLVQPLNLPRPKLDADPESLIEAIATRDPGWLRMMYGDPMQCVADALRPMFMAGEGKNLCSVDLSSIESVGIAAIAGEERKLDVFRRGDDPYSVTASDILGRPITKATDPKARQEVGKVCLAENSLVLSSRGFVFVQDVQKEDKLWDGVEWVSHQGVVCNGVRDTLSLSGLWMTPDHLVLCGDQWYQSKFLEASPEKLFCRALATGAENWLSLVSSLPPGEVCTGSSSGVTAGGRSARTRSRVYDILSCGPRNRFLALTSRGPLVVHNCELAFGFGGGVGAWRNFDDSDRFDDDEVNGFKNAWRSKHPNIARPPWDQAVKDGEAGVGLWYGLQDAAHEAVLKPGKQCEAFGVKYQVRGRWLVCTLPSSRNIAYYDPRLQEKVNPHTDRSEVVLSYMSQKSGHWQRIETWGGKLAQGVTQATCRDILVHGQRRCDPEMPVLITVYDEIVTEVEEELGVDLPVERLINFMVGDLPAWCAHWPVKAEGWCGRRYRK